VIAAAGGAVDIQAVSVMKIPRYTFRRIYGDKSVWKSM
jgi:hypothetical protein